ncbi:MAG: hypothetical protein KIS78_22080 [Labilithrix sp.]|nr:hypothetical protein [Labilithrix sp.]MCW5835104.1 hypothetical protein [Labilithrix sp.]
MRPARARFVYAGVVATAAMHLWCSSDDDAAGVPGPDAGGDDAAPIDAGAEAEADAGAAECSDAFCRVALPGVEALGLYGLHAKSASEIWLVGSRGFAARFDGAAWRPVPTGITAAIFGVTSTSDGVVWGASSGQAFLKLNGAPDGGAETVDGGFKGVVHAVGANGSEVFAVGRMFFDFSVGEPPSDNIWRYGAAPDGGGPEWRAVSPPCPMGEWEPECLELRAVWVESASRQWFAGDDGRVFRTDTSAAEPGDARIALAEMNSSSLRRLNGLWGFGANDVWAVGAQGVIRHYTGGDAWTPVASPVTEDLYGVWGSRPDDVWAVGDRGAVVHWDGRAWTVKDVPFPEENRPRLYAVAGAGGDVWVAGAGVLLRSARAAGGDR